MTLHTEFHRTEHIGWLRAAVLGANDGLISTSSLVVGVAAAQSERAPVLLAALAGLVAGALSMAAGEYVSVSSQSDTEAAAAFAAGAAPPLLLVVFVPLASVSISVTLVTIALLIGLGSLAAKLGGAPMLRGAARVTFWGAVAMGATALVGRMFGTVT